MPGATGIRSGGRTGSGTFVSSVYRTGEGSIKPRIESLLESKKGKFTTPLRSRTSSSGHEIPVRVQTERIESFTIWASSLLASRIFPEGSTTQRWLLQSIVLHTSFYYSSPRDLSYSPARKNCPFVRLTTLHIPT